MGVAEGTLANLDADIAAGKYPLVDRMLVVRCGAIVYDRKYLHDYGKIYSKEARTKGPLNARLTGPYNYFDPNWHPYYHGSDEHTMQSVSKTVTSVTLGIAISRKDFTVDLDTPVLKYFDPAKVARVDDRKRHLTIRHLLTMTTGLDWNEGAGYDNADDSTSQMEATDDWIQFVIDRPMAREPGPPFAYNSGATELLAHIFQKQTGQDLEQYARKYLFEPLGIRHYHWKRSPKGVVDTEGGLYLRAEDLAKIGFLFLHNGTWAGKQIVSADWVKQSLAPSVDAGDRAKYGFQWWLFPQGDPQRLIWAALGFGGQRLLVFPQENLMVVFTGWSILGDSMTNQQAIQRILPAVQKHDCASSP
jgi:CubicO group peptidase (beta-lactamase class C family)